MNLNATISLLIRFGNTDSKVRTPQHATALESKNNNNNFICRVLLKQATKKKNETFITRRFGLLMTPLSIFLHLRDDCNIIHISLDNGVTRTPKRQVINLSFFSLN